MSAIVGRFIILASFLCVCSASAVRAMNHAISALKSSDTGFESEQYIHIPSNKNTSLESETILRNTKGSTSDPLCSPQVWF